jgi:hypothetical protein
MSGRVARASVSVLAKQTASYLTIPSKGATSMSNETNQDPQKPTSDQPPPKQYATDRPQQSGEHGTDERGSSLPGRVEDSNRSDAGRRKSSDDDMTGADRSSSGDKRPNTPGQGGGSGTKQAPGQGGREGSSGSSRGGGSGGNESGRGGSSSSPGSNAPSRGRS